MAAKPTLREIIPPVAFAGAFGALGVLATLAHHVPAPVAISLGASIAAGMLIVLLVRGPRWIDAVCRRNAKALIERLHQSGVLPPR